MNKSQPGTVILPMSRVKHTLALLSPALLLLVLGQCFLTPGGACAAPTAKSIEGGRQRPSKDDRSFDLSIRSANHRHGTKSGNGHPPLVQPSYASNAPA